MDWIFHRKQGTRLPSAAPSLPRKTVLIIGEAGCGKSTLVNTLTNYFRNGSLDNLQFAAPTHYCLGPEGYTGSDVDRTTFHANCGVECATYSFISEGMVYNFIDTPGLNDSRGVDQDEKNLEKILTAAYNAKDLAAILFVINGTRIRVTPALRNVFVSLRGNLPDSVTDNIIVVLTKCHADTTAFKLSNLAEVAPDIKKESIFYMNNTAFVSKPKNGRLVQSEILVAEWNTSMKTCAKIVTRVRSFTQVATEDFATMRTNRFELKRILNNVKVEMVNLQGLLEQFDAAENTQKQEREQKQEKKQERGQEPGQTQEVTDKESFQNFLKTHIVTSTVPRTTPYLNTVCSNCDYVCHQHCSMNDIKENGSNDFIRCHALSDGKKCNTCPGKCSYSTHYHTNQVFLDVEETMEMVLQGLLRNYTSIQQYNTTVVPLIATFSSAKAAVILTMQQKMDDLRELCRTMKEICSSFHFTDELRQTLTQLSVVHAQLHFTNAQQAAREVIHAFTCLIEDYSREGCTLDKGINRKNHISNEFERQNVSLYPADMYILSNTSDVTENGCGRADRRARLPIRKSYNDAQNLMCMGNGTGSDESMNTGTGARMVMRIGSSRTPSITTGIAKSVLGKAVSDMHVTQLTHLMRDMTVADNLDDCCVDNLDNGRGNNLHSSVDGRSHDIAADKLDSRFSNAIDGKSTSNDRFDDRFTKTDVHARNVHTTTGAGPASKEE